MIDRKGYLELTTVSWVIKGYLGLAMIGHGQQGLAVVSQILCRNFIQLWSATIYYHSNSKDIFTKRNVATQDIGINEY